MTRVFILKKTAIGGLFLQLFSGVNANLLASLCDRLKLDGAVNESEKGVVRSAAHINAGMNLGTALSYDNISCKDSLTVRFFTPRRLASLSRPFFVEPTPFLCAKN